ncbi:hypothetical protein F2P79_009083 [Pimephales promelas]|nr:hypothetical protein F2P79_009083 [Pimephales promelas]
MRGRASTCLTQLLEDKNVIWSYTYILDALETRRDCETPHVNQKSQPFRTACGRSISVKAHCWPAARIGNGCLQVIYLSGVTRGCFNGTMDSTTVNFPKQRPFPLQLSAGALFYRRP